MTATTLERRHLAVLVDRIDAAEQIRRRAVQQAMADALACTWTRRAEMFEWARPRPGDYTGTATEAELAEADRRCAEAAQACRRAAELRLGVAGFDRLGGGVWEVAA